MRAFAVLFCALACACGASTSTASTPAPVPDLPQPDLGKTYVVHMTRPFHVGQRLHFVSDADEMRVTTMTRDGSTIDKKRSLSRAHFDAVLTVVALDERADALRISYAVTDLSKSGDKIETLLANQRVDMARAKKDEDATVLVDGVPASADLRETLRMVVSFRVGGPSDDDVFGTNERRSVGAHWPIDARRAHDDLVADQGPAMEPAVLDGDVTLAGVRASDGIPCLDLRSELHIKNLTVPSAPAGSSVIDGSATASFEGLFPIDERAQRLTDDLTLVMSLKLRTPTPQGDVVVAVSATSKRERRLTPL